MGNEMGNNNASGLREEDNTPQEKSQQEIAHADGFKGQNQVVSATQDNDSLGKETGLVSDDVGREDPNSDDQKTDNKEEDYMKTEGKKSMQDATQTDDDKGQNHEVLASEDIYVNEQETGLASITQEGVAKLHNDNRKHGEKEQDYNMITEAKVKSLQEAAYADEATGQDHLVPAADDKNTQGNEPELVSSEPDGIASPNVDKQKQDEKEKDTSSKSEEIPFQEAGSTVETKEEAHIVSAPEDKNTHEYETWLVSSEPDGIASPNVDKQKQDEKEKDSSTKAEEIPSQEAASTVETNEEAQIVPAAEDENTHEYETQLVSSEPDGIASSNVDKQKQDEKEKVNNTKAEEKPLQEAASTVETNEEAQIVPAAEDENTHEYETQLVCSEPDGIASSNVDKQKQDEKEKDNNTKAEEKPLQEAASTVETNEVAQIVPQAEDENTHEYETQLVCSEPDGIASSNVDKQKQDEKEQDNNTKAEEKPLQEAASTVETNEEAQIVPAAEGENTHEYETQLVSSEPDGIASSNVDKQKQDEKEQDNNTKAEEKPSQEAASTVETNEEAQIVPAAEDENTHEYETQLGSSEHDGIASSNVDKQKQDEKEKDNNTKAEEKPLQEAASTVETNEVAQIVPAAEDENTHEYETQLVCSAPDGIASSNVDKQKQDEKEQDNNTKAEEKPLQEAASTVETNEEAQIVPAAEGENTHEYETQLVSSEPDGIASSNVDKQKQDEKEQDNNTKAEEKPSQEADSTVETNEEAQIVPAAEDEKTHEYETQLASSEHDGIASSNVDKQKQDEKEKDNNIKAEEKPLQEAASTVETKAEAHMVPAAGEKNTHGIETCLVSSDHEGMAHPRVGSQKQDEKEEVINIKNDEAKEKSSQEAASTDVVERQDHLLPALEDKDTHGNEAGLVSSDPEGTYPHSDNRKQHEKEEGNTDTEPLSKHDHADDIEEKNLTIPAAEGEDCNNTEAEAEAEMGSSDALVVGDTLANQTTKEQEQGRTELHTPDESRKVEEKPSEAFDGGRETQPTSLSQNLEEHEIQKETNFMENLSRTSYHFENQNSMMKEDEETSNSISDAASSTSHDSVPQETAVVKPEEHELANFHTEQPVQVCNGPLKSEDLIIPSLTGQAEENGFILDSSTSSDDFLVEEMATKEVTSKDQFELKDGDEVRNHLGNITTMMTDLPNGVRADCNGEFPSEMNSIKNDSPESQVEAYLSDEILTLLVEVSKTEEKGIVLSQKATLVRNESENRNCRNQSGEQSIEKSDSQGSEEGSNTYEQNASPPQSMMIGHLVDASINYQNEATEEQQDTQKAHLVTDPAVISADIFLTDKRYKEEDSEEKKMVEKIGDSNPIGNDKSKRENGRQCISGSFPIEQAEAVLSPSPFLHALTEKQQQDSYMECKKVHNSNESMAELKQESSCEFSTTEASFFDTHNSTEKNVVSLVELTGQKPLWDLSEGPKPSAVTMADTKPSFKQSSEQFAIDETPPIAEGDYYQRETVGRFSSESNSDNTSIHAQMRKSPSFDLDLRIDARAEESDQTPLLYQDKTTIESFSSQTEVTENGKNSLQCEAMPVEEKVVKLERSDSEKSKTPFPSFLKEEEEADQNQMLITPKKQDKQSAAKKATKVSAKEVKSASTEGKEKRKPRSSLFGTCMCCATVIN